jgi:hypothetical protein
VLSACNTAVADKLGAEALSGLVRAFFYAGRGRFSSPTGRSIRRRRPGAHCPTFAVMKTDLKLGRAAA